MAFSCLATSGNLKWLIYSFLEPVLTISPSNSMEGKLDSLVRGLSGLDWCKLLLTLQPMLFPSNLGLNSILNLKYVRMINLRKKAFFVRMWHDVSHQFNSLATLKLSRWITFLLMYPVRQPFWLDISSHQTMSKDGLWRKEILKWCIHCVTLVLRSFCGMKLKSKMKMMRTTCPLCPRRKHHVKWLIMKRR